MGYGDPLGKKILLVPCPLDQPRARRVFVSEHLVRKARLPVFTKKMHQRIGRHGADRPVIVPHRSRGFREHASRSAPSRMLAKPVGEGFLFDVSRGEPKHCGGGFDLVRRKIETVETEKNIGRQQRRPFVSIDKRVVANNPRRVGRRETANIALTVGVQVPWPRQGRCEQPGVPHSPGAAMFGELRVVNGCDDRRQDPNRAFHLPIFTCPPALASLYFASSRSALRKLAIPCRATCICRSNSGS